MAQQTLASLQPPEAQTDDPVLAELRLAQQVVEEAERKFGAPALERARLQLGEMGRLDPQAAFGGLGKESLGLGVGSPLPAQGKAFLRSWWENLKEKYPQIHTFLPGRLDIAATIGQPLEEIRPGLLSHSGRAAFESRIQEEMAKPGVSGARLQQLQEILQELAKSKNIAQRRQQTIGELQ
jgi:hypothetical protein